MLVTFVGILWIFGGLGAGPPSYLSLPESDHDFDLDDEHEDSEDGLTSLRPSPQREPVVRRRSISWADEKDKPLDQGLKPRL